MILMTISGLVSGWLMEVMKVMKVEVVVWLNLVSSFVVLTQMTKLFSQIEVSLTGGGRGGVSPV